MAKTEFNVAKVMETLAKQEQEGYTFYEQAAGHMTDEKAKKTFEKLAKDEHKHETFYLKQMEKYKGKSYQIDQEDAEFLTSLLDETSPIQAAQETLFNKGVWNRDQALAVAEKLERDTILFLSQIITLNDEFAKETAFTTALREEKQHLLMIMRNNLDRHVGALML